MREIRRMRGMREMRREGFAVVGFRDQQLTRTFNEGHYLRIHGGCWSRRPTTAKA